MESECYELNYSKKVCSNIVSQSFQIRRLRANIFCMQFLMHVSFIPLEMFFQCSWSMILMLSFYSWSTGSCSIVLQAEDDSGSSLPASSTISASTTDGTSDSFTFFPEDE